METELSLQEQAFRTYLDLEAEELRQLCEALKARLGKSNPDYIPAMRDVALFVAKRAAVIREADTVFKAVQAAKERGMTC